MKRVIGLGLIASLHPVALAQTPPIVAPTPVAPAVIGPRDTCAETLDQALEELEFWRTQAAAQVPMAPSVPTVAMGPIVSERVEQVAAALKSMKPEQAALVVADWDDGLATTVLAALPARASGTICAALPPELAARLLSRLARMTIEEAP